MHIRSKPQNFADAPAGSALRTQVMVGVALVAVVFLLTLLFSVLGTISSGAVLGMVFGTMKHCKWQVALASLVFPLVSLANARFIRFDSTLVLTAETWVLAMICFGVFWVSYLLTGAAAYFEQKPVPAPVKASNCGPSLIQPVPGEIPQPASASDPNLKDLQGSWARLAAPDREAACAETIDIKHDHFLVRVPDGDGKLRTTCAGHVRVTQIGPYKVGAVIPEDALGIATAARFESAPWLFKVVGEMLTVGWNFEETAPDRGPQVENYRRMAPAIPLSAQTATEKTGVPGPSKE